MTTTNDALTPDLTSYRTIHHCLRIAAHRMAGAAASAGPGDLRRAEALSRYWKGYAGEVLSHHTIEDASFFPALVERVPVAAELIGRTDKDHDHLDHLMEEIDAALADWAAGGDKAPVAPLLADLAEHMDAHLDFEDEDILPLFERHFTAAEYEALDEAAVKDLGIGKQAAFTVPFVMHWVDDERRAEMLAGAPLPLKVLWRLTRRRHARLTDAALAELARPEAA